MTTNRVGATDANGNSSAYGWDAENRLVASSNPPAASYTRYAYDGQNKQIWSCTWNTSSSLCTTDNGYSFYSPAGKLLGTFSVSFTPYYYVNNGNGYQLIPDSLTITNGTPLAYFGSRRLWLQDRVGSQGRFFPYGEDRTGMNYPQSGQYAFATYLDNGSGVYYADQRWYAAAPGRFLSPDPYMAVSGGTDPGTPQSFDRYAYVENDPVNHLDPTGQFLCTPDMLCTPSPGDPCPVPESTGPSADCGQGGGGGGGGGNDCLDGLSQRDINYVTRNASAAYVVSAQFGGVLSGEFILAWAAVESAFGTSAVSQNNNNYFGEKFLACDAQGMNCKPNTNPQRTAPWASAIPCAQLGGAAAPGFACFGSPNLFGSAYAALSSGKGKYLNVAQSVAGESVAQIAQAIADAGWCQQGLCRTGGYGRQVQQDYNELLPVLNCLFAVL